MSFWKKAEQMDRRWVYLMVGLTVIIPFIVPANFPISISPEGRALYDYVDGLKDGSHVMLVFDYYPSTIAECEPMT